MASERASIEEPRPQPPESIVTRRRKPATSRLPTLSIFRRLNHQNQIFGLALLAGLPASIVALVLLWGDGYSSKVRWTLTALVLFAWLGCALALRERVMRPLQTMSNLLAALREGDYSIRARGAKPLDALGEVIIEVNALGETLREQRLGALEATALLRTVMAEIDVAIFAFDAGERLRLVNRAGERLLRQPGERLAGMSATELKLADYLRGDALRVVEAEFPAGSARWEIRRSQFREHGMPVQLLVVANLSRALREEERAAWQRLVRVLGHELNNSLTPIKSIAGSLESLLSREPQPPDWREDVRQGLAIIAKRSEALSRFMNAYARLARLPAPVLRPVDVAPLIRRAASLETRLSIKLQDGPALVVEADEDQLEQLLINLLRNAVDAALETSGHVHLAWRQRASVLEIIIEDDGPGLSNTSNLFVPFFTTKPNGSGIGLVLSRQIAEAHGGSLTLQDRPHKQGCEARLTLPLKQA
ncbi:MAG: two-component system, NtrC family, nitrogen regulation sensor histidine kinase NtrY [Blastocatellia bacterium]|jgi:nitrogen fixation/metabolism regulation signal transduction histidine kinase|nr:two-component system, NtrC family, nitrogen regulation sensor histidine kinase NtrY [Blastocatellia bacterium]